MKTGKTLAIKWERLIDEKGRTCKRCGATEKELQKAVQSLEKSLDSSGIKVSLEEKTLDASEFAKDPSVSNRIRIGGKPMEEWLSGESGRSPCCDVCGDAQCRTLDIGGRVYETIPADLIIKAGLIAASRLLDED